MTDCGLSRGWSYMLLLRTDKNGKVEKIVNACLVDTELLTSILANTEERM